MDAISLKKTRKPASYRLEVFDEEGNKRAEYEGNDDLKPRTASVLLVNFRLFKLLLMLFNCLLGFVIGKFLSGLF